MARGLTLSAAMPWLAGVVIVFAVHQLWSLNQTVATMAHQQQALMSSYHAGSLVHSANPVSRTARGVGAGGPHGQHQQAAMRQPPPNLNKGGGSDGGHGPDKVAVNRPNNKPAPNPNANANPNSNANANGGNSKKPAFVEPVPEEAWALVPEEEANLEPLPGEGVVDLGRLPPRKGYGVLMNAIHRQPSAQRASKPIAEALAGAVRFKAALKESGSSMALGVVLFTEKEPWAFMNDPVKCRANLWPECADFAEGKDAFDAVIFYEDLGCPAVVERRERFQTWPELWLKRIVASQYSPFEVTLVVDSDVYACSTFLDIFKMLEGADVALSLASAPYGSSRNYNGAFRTGLPESYAEFQERNLGLQILRTGNPAVIKWLAHFQSVYVRMANDTQHVSIGNDQSAAREALFMAVKRGDIKLAELPADIACRFELGCPDGCLLVHRHEGQTLSGDELVKMKRERQLAKKAEREQAKKQQKDEEVEEEGGVEGGEEGEEGEEVGVGGVEGEDGGVEE